VTGKLEASVPVLVVTGPVGVGKTSVSEEIFDQLAARDITHAVVDLDALGLSWPYGEGDPFQPTDSSNEPGRRMAELCRDRGRGPASEIASGPGPCSLERMTEIEPALLLGNWLVMPSWP
jgi:hypothetical protein